jgi:urease accessory protein UreF
MKKDTLIDLYWILDALQRGAQPDADRVGACFIAIRDALLDPDTEQIVDHIRSVLERSEAAADVLAHQLIGRSSAATRRPLPASRLRELMASAQSETAGADLAVTFGRRVEAAHGIGT